MNRLNRIRYAATRRVIYSFIIYAVVLIDVLTLLTALLVMSVCLRAALREPRVGEDWVDFHFPSCAWARTLNRKKNDVQTSPGSDGQCLHEEIEEISTLLAGSTRVSRRVTQQEGLTRLDYSFPVNAYKHLTAKGLSAAVIQLGLKSNPGSCKECLPYILLVFSGESDLW